MDRERILAVRGREEIKDEAQYMRVFGKPSDGVDWTAYRILVVQLTTTYRLQELHSEVNIAGMEADDDGIYIGMELVQYGPVQGIAQFAEWFSYDRTDLFLLLPGRPAPD